MPTSFVVPDRLPKSQRRPSLLLHPQIPVPMHGVAPRLVMPNAWWVTIRRDALAKYGQFCWACGYPNSANPIRQVMDIHETYHINYFSGRMVFLEAVVLCYFCHSYIHMGRTNELQRTKKMTTRVYKMIVKHGTRVLKEAGLSASQQPQYRGRAAPWAAWRLVVGTQEFPPAYANQRDWEAAYRNTAAS